MRLLIFTDNHGSLSSLDKVIKKSKNADLLIQTGDISVFEQNLDYLINKLSKINKNILILHGNHESESILRKECSFYKNIIFFHKRIKKINDILFIGYGGEGFSLRAKDFENFIKKNNSIIKKNKKIVLIIHQPPYGALDLVMREHTGNKSFADFIYRYNPILVFCGHLHENENKENRLGKALIINPGPNGRIISL